jgi:hypothetical protein
MAAGVLDGLNFVQCRINSRDFSDDRAKAYHWVGDYKMLSSEGRKPKDQMSLPEQSSKTV